MKYGYIYKHTNKINGHVYIGQSTQTPERRFRKGAKGYGSYKTCPAFHAALVKYTWAGFMEEILEWADNQEELNKLEEHYINLYQSADGTNGYNTMKFSQGRGKQAESTKKILSEQKKKMYADMKEKGIKIVPHNKREHTIINSVTGKICTGPETPHWTPLTEFGSHKDTWDKLLNHCKLCRAKAQAEYRKHNPEETLTPEEFQASYRKRSNAMSEGQKRRFENHPESFNGGKKNAKEIIRINPTNGETKKYESGLAAKADGFDNTYVSQACKTGKLFKGYKWLLVKKETGPKDPAS